MLVLPSPVYANGHCELQIACPSQKVSAATALLESFMCILCFTLLHKLHLLLGSHIVVSASSFQRERLQCFCQPTSLIAFASEPGHIFRKSRQSRIKTQHLAGVQNLVFSIQEGDLNKCD